MVVNVRTAPDSADNGRGIATFDEQQLSAVGVDTATLAASGDRSSDGESTGLLIRRSVVRVHPGALGFL